MFSELEKYNGTAEWRFEYREDHLLNTANSPSLVTFAGALLVKVKHEDGEPYNQIKVFAGYGRRKHNKVRLRLS